METIPLTIDGKSISVPAGTSIMAAADRLGIRIPRLCHHPDLEPFGACRLCLVEDERSGRLAASCVTPVAPDMAVRTDTPRVMRHRRNIVRLMIAEHPESCIVCSKGNRCQLRQIAARLGIGVTDLYPMPNPRDLQQANPFIIRDLSKCILCGKCIRADHELVAVGAIDYNLRGFKSRPATVHDLGLEQSCCTFCGTCVSMCPTGALSARNTAFVGTPDRESTTICGFCGVGCSLTMGAVTDQVVETNPSHRQDTVNGATLCVRGHFATDFLNAQERIVEPMIRDQENTLVPAGWEEALERTAQRLSEIHRQYGPQSIAFLGSAKCSIEENYLFQKIARVLFKTNNIDTAAHFLGQPQWTRLHHRLSGHFRTAPLTGLLKADAILVVGSDPSQSVPVVGYFLKRAARQGIPLVVADPRRTELAGFASVWLPVSVGADAALLNGLTVLLHEKDSRIADPAVQGYEAFRESMSTVDLDRVGRITGIDRDCLQHAADTLSGKKICFVVGGGVLQQAVPAPILDALINLAILTGSAGRKSGWLYLPTYENNQAGAWDMGAVPDALPGGGSLQDETGRRSWEQSWQTKISPDGGLNAARMIEEAEKGNIKALYILGENPLRSFPQPDRVRRVLKDLKFLAVQDIILTDTARLADTVLPGAPFSEKEGAFTNMEGRIQTFRPAVPCRGNAKPDWEILALLAQKLSPAQSYTIERIREEIRRLVPPYRHFLNKGDTAWIEPFSKAGDLEYIPIAPPAEPKSDTTFPYTAFLCSSRFHLGSGTRTALSERIRKLQATGAVEISIPDAEKLGISDGASVRIVSEWGTLERESRRSRDLAPGQILVPKAFAGNSAMNLVGLTPSQDKTFTGWRTVPVRMEPL